MKVGEGLSKQESADVKAQMYRSGIVDDIKTVKPPVFGDEREVGGGGKAHGGGFVGDEVVAAEIYITNSRWKDKMGMKS
jgi:hypothetical protein